MALDPAARKALTTYLDAAATRGSFKATIAAAVVLTDAQRIALSAIATAYWGKPMACPICIDLKPQHGFDSRISKDGFTCEQLLEWWTAGCSDVATAESDPSGRPFLCVPITNDGFDIHVPIRTDSNGRFTIDSVIPKGLRGGQKKTVPSAFP